MVPTNFFVRPSFTICRFMSLTQQTFISKVHLSILLVHQHHVQHLLLSSLFLSHMEKQSFACLSVHFFYKKKLCNKDFFPAYFNRFSKRLSPIVLLFSFMIHVFVTELFCFSRINANYSSTDWNEDKFGERKAWEKKRKIKEETVRWTLMYSCNPETQVDLIDRVMYFHSFLFL